MIEIGKAYVWKLVDGQIKELLIGNLIIKVSDTEFLEEQNQILIEKPEQTEKKTQPKQSDIPTKTKPYPKPQKTHKTAGKKIARIRNIPIEKNIYSDIEIANALDDAEKISVIIRAYKPNITEKSLNTYKYAYRSYINKQQGKTTRPTTTELGKVVESKHNYSIREKPLVELRCVPNLTQAKAVKILKKYYTSAPQSLNRLAGTYCKYIQKHPNLRDIANNNQKKKEELQDKRGPVIGHVNKLPIHANVYNEIMKHKGNIEKATQVIRDYYPNVKPNTARTYRIHYLSYKSTEKLAHTLENLLPVMWSQGKVLSKNNIKKHISANTTNTQLSKALKLLQKNGKVKYNTKNHTYEIKLTN